MRLRSALVVALAVALLATACTRDTGTDKASDTTAGKSSTTAATDTNRLDNGAFGDLGTVCSAGDKAAEPISDQPGIEDTTINIGTVSDAGFAGRPGLNQELFDSSEAVTKWCNEHGGVGGYKIALNELDAKLTEHLQRMVEACDTDFFLVGGGAVFDDAGQDTRLGCGLPDIAGYQVTPTALDSDISLSAAPTANDEWGIGDLLFAKEKFPDAIDKIGVMTGGIATTQLVAQRYQEAFPSLGFKQVYYAEYNPLGEPWKPFAQKMKDDGVEILLYVGEPQNLAALRKAMDEIDYAPVAVLATSNHYDESYIAEGGDAVRNTFIRGGGWPRERADENPATADYVELMHRYDPGGRIALLGGASVSAWMLFLTSLHSCVEAGTVTRDCVWTEASKQRKWTGGGLSAPVDPTKEHTLDCFTIMEATADGFVMPDFGANDGIFRCDPKAVFHSKLDLGPGAHCPSGKADPLPSECA